MEEERNCKNCKHYMPHYIKEKAYIIEIDGHCMNSELNRHRPRDRWKLKHPCDYWELQENRKEERRKSIKETLRNMEKSLEDIKLILQSDKD